jgi:hypothetical protein
MRLSATRYIVSVALFLAQAAGAQEHSSIAHGLRLELEAGRIGALSVGMQSEAIERMLKRPLALQFAGEKHRGVTIEAPSDLGRVGLTKLHGQPVSSIDVFFMDQGAGMSVDFISVGVPCSSVPLLGRELAAAIQQPNKASSALQSERRYVWGVESKPSCRVWLRAA